MRYRMSIIFLIALVTGVLVGYLIVTLSGMEPSRAHGHQTRHEIRASEIGVTNVVTNCCWMPRRPAAASMTCRSRCRMAFQLERVEYRVD
jgi:hypothetical protein